MGKSAMSPAVDAGGRGNRGSPRARVFLVDDHALIRRGLGVVLNSTADLAVCGEAGTGAEVLQLLGEAKADVVLLDLSLPDADGIELIGQIRARHPDLPILVLSMHNEMLYAPRALRAGAQGYVTKQDSLDRVVEGVRCVLAGRVFVSEAMKLQMLSSFCATGPRISPTLGVERLSNRELQVFNAIGRGQTTAQIAASCALSPKTVETYRSNIKRKLGLPNATMLVHTAVRWGESAASGAAAPLRSENT